MAATAQQPELDSANASADRTLNDAENGGPDLTKIEAAKADKVGDSSAQKIWKKLRGDVDPDRVSEVFTCENVKTKLTRRFAAAVHPPALSILPHDRLDGCYLFRCCLHLCWIPDWCVQDGCAKQGIAHLCFRKHGTARCSYHAPVLGTRSEHLVLPPCRQACLVQLDLLRSRRLTWPAR